MDQRKWKSFVWLGAVLLVATLAVGAWMAVPSALAAPQASGDLEAYLFSIHEYLGAYVAQPVSYTLMYSYLDADGPATNVRLVNTVPDEVVIDSISTPPTSRNGNQLIWTFPQLVEYQFGQITITGHIREDVVAPIVITNTVTIESDATDIDPTNNRVDSDWKIKPLELTLWLFKWGLMEESKSGGNYAAEWNVPTDFSLSYFNFTYLNAPNIKVVDRLPEGLEYISADPAPSQINGQELVWEIGNMAPFDFGEITLRVRPTVTGTLENKAYITSTMAVEAGWNDSSFSFKTVPLLMPRILKPSGLPSAKNPDKPFITGSSLQMKGMARAGSTMNLYTGSPDGCWGDFSYCDPVLLASAPVGADRMWELSVTLPVSQVIPLYWQVEKDGRTSAPDFSDWEPVFVFYDPTFEQAGFDFDNFTVGTDAHEVNPGGLGGSSGTTPNETFTMTVRQNVPPAVINDKNKWGLHDYKLVYKDADGNPITETLPVKEMRPVAGAARPQAVDGWWGATDLIYVHKGFGPGSTIEIWCRPVYYPDDWPDSIEIPGLVWVLCHKIVVDPAGYVYEIRDNSEYKWPAVPPSDRLITNATVTVTVRTGDDTWVRWPAEETAQINPQVTDWRTPDRINIPGYFAFYVPAGQYRVEATAPYCSPYVSPILTVVDEPVFHNVGMRCTSEAQTGVGYTVYMPSLRR